VQGERFQGVAKTVLKMVAGADHIGELQALESRYRQKGMDDHMPSFNGVRSSHRRRLAVRGGTNDRMFRAFDARTGKCCGSSRPARRCRGASIVPSRRQAIYRGAIRLGRRPSENATRMNLIFPGQYPDVPQGGAVWVFAVK